MCSRPTGRWAGPEEKMGDLKPLLLAGGDTYKKCSAVVDVDDDGSNVGDRQANFGDVGGPMVTMRTLALNLLMISI